MRARRWLLALFFLLSLPLAGLLLFSFAVIIVWPNLPSLEVLTDYRPKIPLRVYSSEGDLIGEFGEERRAVIRIGEVPELMKRAIVAAEDERFYEHGGVDYQGVARAALSNFASGGARQGASTITMQVARNFFLSKEKTFLRKFNEMLLAFKIEHSLSKDEILQLYLNQIYLGQRAYGFAAAARIYFGKPLKDLTLGEISILAGLPKAPSRYNPVTNATRAKQRQRYVLRRMRELGYADEAQVAAAEKEPLRIRGQLQEATLPAEFAAEMVRQAMVERYHEDAYHLGFRVYTTIETRKQVAAHEAVRSGVLAYDRRHGYRGPEGFANLSANPGPEELEDALQDLEPSGDLLPGVVLAASPKLVQVYVRGGKRVEVQGDGLKFAQSALSAKASANLRIRRGALVRVRDVGGKGWQILQMPTVEAALISVSPTDGAVKALVGGFDFARNKFNHVTQAMRQPGSSFKPFIYSAALEKGYTPATIVDDEPLRFEARQTGSEAWEPRNFDGKFEGPMRLRAALAKSKNLVSVRLLESITPQYAQDYITRFGFDPKLHPPYLTMALGAGTVTPLQMAAGYAVFANGGYRIAPHLIERIEDSNGRVIFDNRGRRSPREADRVIDARNAFIMSSMLQEVVKSGTAARALQLKRSDLGGKTGTTNDFIDAWFAGFQPDLVAVAWIGFDTPHTLGRNETGSQAALPMWIDFMREALKDVPDRPLEVPQGIVATRIDPDTGLRDAQGAYTEFFYQEFLPPEMPASWARAGEDRATDEVRSQLF